ncbi:DUF1517 domain-containing protein [Pantanalinema rosaneae CENA516]|uniref:DUF1517 domain-containing protein n=1 Tax=Pantanalinema rosaneae TaxID=1620701 RepID=UPI003D6EE08B
MDIHLENIDPNELTNDIVTVSQLQVALRADGYGLQTRLTELGEQADTSTSEGLFELLQQVAKLLLERSSYWTHVLASSETVYSREDAETLFIQRSLHERSKFQAETFSNVDGVIREEPLPTVLADQETAARPLTTNRSHKTYTVVTLLLGTADDQPLFGEIYTTSVLRDVLQDISMMRSPYLLAFELLWTPQLASDVLTEADLAADYGDMIAID